MSNTTYWLDLFTGTTWDEFLAAAGSVSGFRESRWTTVKRIIPGDLFLCYVTGVSRFIGLLEVQSEAFKDDAPIWGTEVFPCRLKVKPLIVLSGETAVPVTELRDRLSFFTDSDDAHHRAHRRAVVAG
jgi:hypothetical protein